MRHAIAFRIRWHDRAAAEFRSQVHEVFGTYKISPEGRLYWDDLETWVDHAIDVIFWMARTDAGELWLLANQPPEAGVVESF